MLKPVVEDERIGAQRRDRRRRERGAPRPTQHRDAREPPREERRLVPRVGRATAPARRPRRSARPRATRRSRVGEHRHAAAARGEPPGDRDRDGGLPRPADSDVADGHHRGIGARPREDRDRRGRRGPPRPRGTAPPRGAAARAAPPRRAARGLHQIRSTRLIGSASRGGGEHGLGGEVAHAAVVALVVAAVVGQGAQASDSESARPGAGGPRVAEVGRTARGLESPPRSRGGPARSRTRRGAGRARAPRRSASSGRNDRSAATRPGHGAERGERVAVGRPAAEDDPVPVLGERVGDRGEPLRRPALRRPARARRDRHDRSVHAAGASAASARACAESATFVRPGSVMPNGASASV